MAPDRAGNGVEMIDVNVLKPGLAGRIAAVIAAFFCAAAPALAEPAHGIAMYGAPALPPDFVSLPYVNPEAPKGGRMRQGESGGFDSLNPYILKGRAPWAMGQHVVETMMARSLDEPFTLYGLLAESVETDAARTWVEFTLREGARFSDGAPVTIEDVIWSYETLGTKGSPRYHTAWAKVAKIEPTGPRKLRISFNAPDRELAMLMGMRPILQKAQFAGRDFADTADIAPIGSGPYTVGGHELGRYISFRRNPDYWGRDLAVNRGRNNLDELRYDYFGDGGVVFEAFKAGEIDLWAETNSAKWAAQYDFPAVTSGEIVQSVIAHGRPSGMTGLVMNTRNPVFQDWRVREALLLAFNFEFINQTLNGGTEPRIASYFSNSPLGMGDGPASGRVAELLAPFAADLPPGSLDAYAQPTGDGTELNRGNTRRAIRLLEEAGWQVEGGMLQNPQGQPFGFEILLVQAAAETHQIVDIYIEALKRLGIAPKVTLVDDAQYRQRTQDFDFDMAYNTWALSLSPGNEQRLYWGRDAVTVPGSRNWMGVASPAVEAMIAVMLATDDPLEHRAATQALDRVLTAGRYVIPIWFSPEAKVAHSRHLRYPEALPIYGYWPGFVPDTWWWEE